MRANLLHLDPFNYVSRLTFPEFPNTMQQSSQLIQTVRQRLLDTINNLTQQDEYHRLDRKASPISQLTDVERF